MSIVRSSKICVHKVVYAKKLIYNFIIRDYILRVDWFLFLESRRDRVSCL